MRQYQKRRRLHMLIAILMSLNIVSVGYATWAITGSSTSSITLSMDSYPVINADDYVTIGEASFDYGRNSHQNANELNLNSARITIPISLKSACFNSTLFDNQMGIELTVTIVGSDGQVKKNFLLNCNISESTDTKETGITSSENNISFNETTGDVMLKQNLTWEDGVTVENKIVYVYVNLVLTPGESGEGINVRSVFEELSGATLQIKAIVKDSVS